MKKLPLILESSEDGWYGRVEGIGDFMPVSYGNSIEVLEEEIKHLISEHQKLDPPDQWAPIDTSKIAFEHYYDLSGLFEKFDVLKISTVAKIAGMNTSLLRQYVARQKYPSSAQTKKIEKVIKQIAEDLSKVAIYA